MPTSHMGHAVIPRPRPHTRPAFTHPDDTGEFDIEPARPVDQLARNPLPRTTWTHGLLAGITAALAVWLTVDILEGADPQVVSGHLRGALAASSVILAVSVSNWRLYRRVERLHSRWRSTTDWWAARAKVADERDAEFRQALHTITDDVTLIGRATANMRRTMPDLVNALSYVNARLNSVDRQVASIGGGQATLAATLDRLTHVMTFLIGQQMNPGGEDRNQQEGDDTWRAYLRDGRGQRDGCDELNLDQLRGYLMGIYDRERGGDGGTETVA